MATSRYFGSTLVTSRSPISTWPEVGDLQPGDDPQRGGLAAARGAEQHQELAGRDVDAQVLHHLDGAERLVEAAERQAVEPMSPDWPVAIAHPLTAPRGRPWQ